MGRHSVEPDETLFTVEVVILQPRGDAARAVLQYLRDGLIVHELPSMAGEVRAQPLPRRFGIELQGRLGVQFHRPVLPLHRLRQPVVRLGEFLAPEILDLLAARVGGEIRGKRRIRRGRRRRGWREGGGGKRGEESAPRYRLRHPAHRYTTPPSEPAMGAWPL